jgi:hypothetical protein
MFRRPFGRPMRRAMMGDGLPLLQRANDLLASGQYTAAAEAYEQLAHGAARRGIPRDAQLLLQAGRCRILADQVTQGMDDLKQGLSIIAGRGNIQRLQRAGGRTVTELTERGLLPQAAEIEAILKGSVPAPVGNMAVNESTEKRTLPVACPTCGAPLRSDEVEWVDGASAECPFCGGLVRAE